MQHKMQGINLHKNIKYYNCMSYYDILEIKNDASKNEIKKAYHKLALKWHPDKNAGNKDAEVKFKKISEAYDILGDDEKRMRYDNGTLGNEVMSRDPNDIFKHFFSLSSLLRGHQGGIFNHGVGINMGFSNPGLHHTFQSTQTIVQDGQTITIKTTIKDGVKTVEKIVH